MISDKQFYQSFDNGFEVRGIFFDISKAFDKVWHKGSIFKLKQNGDDGHLLNILIDFVKERKQRVVFNGQHSKWPNIFCRGPTRVNPGTTSFLNLY